jgi:nucleoside 2-deoxyribosyltransferase
MARVYLAGPITGLGYAEARNGWRKDFAALLFPDIAPLSPMRQEGHLAEIKKIAAHGYEHNPLSSSRGIIAKDLLDIERCDLVVMNFLGAKKVSIGSVWEMGYAKKCGKPIVLIIEVRGPKPGNPHDHLFIVDTADFTCHSVQEAADIVNAVLTPGI